MSEPEIELVLSNATVSQLSKKGIIMRYTHYRNGTPALNPKIPTLMKSYRIHIEPIKISDIEKKVPSKGYRQEEGTIKKDVNVFKNNHKFGYYPEGTSIRFDSTQGRFADDTVLTLLEGAEEFDYDDETEEPEEYAGGFKRRRSRKHKKSHKKLHKKSHKKSHRKRRHH